MVSACAPSAQNMGMPTQKWQSLTDQQQQSLRDEYSKVQQWFRDTNPKLKVYDAVPIAVTIKHGQAMMPPFVKAYEFKMVSANFISGECKKLLLQSKTDAKRVTMRACYNGLRLAIDPSSYDFSKRQGTVFFYNNPMWEQSFTYMDVTTQGYVRLQGSDVTIKTLKTS